MSKLELMEDGKPGEGKFMFKILVGCRKSGRAYCRLGYNS